MEIQRNAPNLSGAKSCPSCQTQIARDAVLCTHCGFDFATGKKAGGEGGLTANRKRVLLIGGGLFAAAVVATVLLWPKPEAPPQIVPAKAPAAPVTPSPAPEETAARQAEADRANFETSKVQAEQTFRERLDAGEPLSKPGEPVELRRKNGLVHKGTFSGISGTGTNRVVLIATPTGEIGIPLALLGNASRRRVDPEYREAFIQRMLSLPAPAAGTPPED